MRLRYYLDPATGEPHIHQHNVRRRQRSKRYLRDRSKIDLVASSHGWRWGKRKAGRYLRVIYVPDPEPDSVFVITAYDLGPKALKALRRRRRRKK